MSSDLRADGDGVRVPIDDWADLQAHLRRFAGHDSVDVSEDRIEVSTGAASFAVTRDGRVEAGMPLHGFEKGDVEALYFEHGDQHVQVEGADGLRYEFRKP